MRTNESTGASWGFIAALVTTILAFTYGSPATYDHEAETEQSLDQLLGEHGRKGYFHGSKCTDNCSGHNAGYAWAEKHGITKPGNCKTKSESFSRGCVIYVIENHRWVTMNTVFPRRARDAAIAYGIALAPQVMLLSAQLLQASSVLTFTQPLALGLAPVSSAWVYLM